MRDEGRRSTVQEILVKYKREPELEKTIYVEGSTDKALIKWFLKQAKINNIIVNEINTINIDTNELFKLGVDDNARGRVITLTTLIKDSIIGIIDSDFDFLKEPTYPHNENLYNTDYACMEMYCFNEEILEKLMLGYGDSKQPNNFSEFQLMLSGILTELFLIRYAKDTIQKDLKKIDFEKYLKLKSKNLAFDRDKYLGSYLSHKSEIIDKFNTFITHLKSNLPTDVKKLINGHDFVTLIQFYLGIKQGKEIFEKSLYTSLEFDKLKKEKMFQKILLTNC